MVADTKKRVGLGDQLQVLFKDEQTVTTLYVHFGSVFHQEGCKRCSSRIRLYLVKVLKEN